MIIELKQPTKWWAELLETFQAKFDGQPVRGMALVAITSEAIFLSLEVEDEHAVELLGAIEIAKTKLMEQA